MKYCPCWANEQHASIHVTSEQVNILMKAVALGNSLFDNRNAMNIKNIINPVPFLYSSNL